MNTFVNIYEAKTTLSKLIAGLQSEKFKKIIIGKAGKPVAQITPFEERKPLKIGIWKGRFQAPPGIEFSDPEILELFGDKI